MKEVGIALQETDKINKRILAWRIMCDELIMKEEEVDYSLNDCEFTVISREQLYNEIWTISVSKVAKKYNVSYSNVKKACEAADIPTPSNTYWGNLSMGKDAQKDPLPPSDISEIKLPCINKTQKTIPKKSELKQKKLLLSETNNQRENCDFLTEHTDVTEKKPCDNLQAANSILEQRLDFLTVEECLQVISVAARIEVVDKKTHKKIIEHKKQIKNWNKTHNVDPLAARKYNSYSKTNHDAPFLWCQIADETFPRVYRILNVLFSCVEELGGQVNDDLSLQIRNERVTYKITEGQSKVPHVLTNDEQKKLAAYDKEKLTHTYATKPQIRAWDYLSNGKLRFYVLDNKYYKDTENACIENHLGEILIDLFEKSEKVRITREEQEDQRRKAEKDRKKRELENKRYNEEVDRTIALENEAEDYNIACKIRAYVIALESKGELTEKELDWVSWAKEKADWYDPTVNRVDRYFGVRKHKEDAENKRPRKSCLYNWHN